MKIANNIKFNAKGKKITLILKGKDSTSDLLIETYVREQFLYIFGLRHILRCDIRKYTMDILKMVSSIDDPLTIVHMEIEGEEFNYNPIELHVDKNILLPIIEIVVNPDREKKIQVFNAYIDKISYHATYNILINL